MAFPPAAKGAPPFGAKPKPDAMGDDEGDPNDRLAAALDDATAAIDAARKLLKGEDDDEGDDPSSGSSIDAIRKARKARKGEPAS